MHSNRVALVTGANRGLGLEICRQLAARGLTVVLCARDPAAAAACCADLGDADSQPLPLGLDVDDDAAIEAAARFCRERFGRLDVLVNNAGVLLDGGGLGGGAASSVWHSEREVMRRTFETNLYGPMKLAQVAVPLMLEGGYGRVVNLSSGMAQLTDMGGGWPAYRCSKTALNALTRILHAEVDDPRIKVNAVSPGWVRTAMGGSNASLSVEQGADTAVWAATLPEDGPSGCFLENRQTIPW